MRDLPVAILPRMASRDIRQLLGNQRADAFLARHWHKQPLLVRNAIPGFTGMLARDELFALAGRDDVASRLVRKIRGRYSLAHGPFWRTQLARLPRRDWTLLVQGVNLHDDDADALLRRFAFVPHARLDDLMMSYAVPGGGVGPHFDSYDVFLLQATGRRRWRYGVQTDLALQPNAPLRILRHFTPQHEATLAPGDLLYLPPDVAHDGTAIDECITCSIGFRAPAYQEVAEAFIDRLRDTVQVPGRYADPDLTPARTPGRIDARMRRRLAAAIAQVRWGATDVARFIGRFLTEPKPDVLFAQPPRRSRATFGRRVVRAGVRLDRRTQLLYDDARLYVNGEDEPLPGNDGTALRRLADRRLLTPGECSGLSTDTLDMLYDWYRHGFLATA